MFEQTFLAIGNFLQSVIERVKPRKTLYYLPGEIGFNIRHNRALDTMEQGGLPELVNLVAANSALDTLETPVAQKIRDALVFTFPEAEPTTLQAKAQSVEPVSRNLPRLVTINVPAAINMLRIDQYTTTLYVKTALNDSDLIYAVDALNQIFKPGDREITGSQVASQSSDEGEQEAGDAVPDDRQTFDVIGVTYNWLAASGQGAGGTVGGPGSIPVPLNQNTARQELDKETSDVLTGQIKIIWAQTQQGASPQISTALKEARDKIRAQDIDPDRIVEIAVLDTVPALPLLAAQFQRFVTDKTGSDKNATLQDLLASDFETTIHAGAEYLTATPKTQHNPNVQFQMSYNLMRHHDERLLMDVLADEEDGIGLHQHPHKMADHGLFVAGTIRDYITRIAPNMKVRIHLIQVLSDYGVGTLSSLQHGLNFVLNDPGRNIAAPLIINCSLMITAPRFGHSFNIFGLNRRARDICRLLALTPAQARAQGISGRQSASIVDMFKPLEDIINSFPIPGSGAGVDIIAAAGNEHLPTMPTKPSARYPAAFDRVMGIGAAKRDGTDTAYTNERDAPPSEGANVLGGESTWENLWNAWVADQGLPGVYIGDFPRLKQPGGGFARQVNQDGWARWAGTSFAAPRAAAILAILRYFA